MSFYAALLRRYLGLRFGESAGVTGMARVVERLGDETVRDDPLREFDVSQNCFVKSDGLQWIVYVRTPAKPAGKPIAFCGTRIGVLNTFRWSTYLDKGAPPLSRIQAPTIVLLSSQ